MNYKKMKKDFVDNFLQWPLPPSVRPDPYPPESEHSKYNSGTNLLTANEAELLFEQVIKPIIKNHKKLK